jgi:hypothetical protein
MLKSAAMFNAWETMKPKAESDEVLGGTAHDFFQARSSRCNIVKYRCWMIISLVPGIRAE